MPVTRRHFIATAAAVGTFGTAPLWASTANSDFTLWQIPLHQTPTQGNSYVLRTNDGKIIVMDGGVAQESGYLRGFLGVLGNEVEAWFISHPHSDHIGACNEILKNPDGITIKTIYHSEFSKDFYSKVEPGSQKLTEEFYENLSKPEWKTANSAVIDVTEPGLTVKIGQTSFKILDVKDESVTKNAYNNSSMVIRVWDDVRSAVFLGDAGIEQGDRLMNSPFRKELDCDFLQLAHHGQQGVREDFYRSIKFNACLWATPLWLYNNDAGQGFNTHTWKTVEIRNLMEELGIKKHFFGWQGLAVVQ
jgi:hypothetical protein